MTEQLHILSNVVLLDSVGLHVTESASCAVGTGYFSGIKRLERGADHPFSSAGLRMGRSCTTSSPPCQQRHVKGWHLPLSQGIFGVSRFGGFYGHIINVNGVTRVASRILL